MASIARREIPAAWRDRAGRRQSRAARRFLRTVFGTVCAVGLSVFPAIFALPAHLSAAPQVEAPASIEYEVKAAFLFNFARFVEWPAASASSSGNFVIGIVGNDDFGRIVQRIVAGKAVNGRTLEVRILRDGIGTDKCQILFLGDPDPARQTSIAKALGAAPILTVVDHDDETGVQEVVRFFMEDRRVRFEIDLNAADRAGLKIGSKLLSVARVVREPGNGGR